MTIRKITTDAIESGTITETLLHINVSNKINAAYNTANTASGSGSGAYDQANNAYGQANAAYGQANTARTTANDAYGQANSAFAAANARLSTSGGSISGDVAITGNLTVTGNATTMNVSNLSVNDSIILLSTNAVGDSNDIGFVGHFDRGSTATHAGLIRKATQNQFYLFDNYEVEPTNNVIDVAGNNFTVGNLRLGIINANSFVTAAGLDVTGQANAAYGAANNRVLKAGDTMTGQLNISSGGLLVTGNVGVGLTAPQTRSHISLGGVNGLVIDSVYAGGGGSVEVFGNAANTVYNLILRSSYNSNPEVVGNAGHKWGIILTGYNGSALAGSQLAKSAGVFAVSEDATAGYNRKVGLSLWSCATDQNFAERVRINGDGNVGIGTTNPSARLDVAVSSTMGTYGPGTLNLILRNTNTAETNSGAVDFTGHSGNGVSPYQWALISAEKQTSAGDNNYGGKLHFWTTSGGASGEVNSGSYRRLTIDSAGRIGIGTTNPSKLLDVNGVMNAVHHEINGKRIFHIFVGGAGIGYGGHSTAASVFVNGTNVFSCGRSWGLVAISTSNGAILHAQTYDVYGSGAETTNFLNALSTFYTNNNIICINTFDEPEVNGGAIRTALVDEYGLKDANMPINSRYAYAAILRHGYGRIAECHSAYWSGATLNASGTNNNRSRASCTATIVA